MIVGRGSANNASNARGHLQGPRGEMLRLVAVFSAISAATGATDGLCAVTVVSGF